MKVISYSIFRAPCEKFEFMAYMRGLYFNARMNRLIYPDWETWIHVEESVYNEHATYFQRMPIHRIEFLPSAPLCESMLWRMRPLFVDGVTHVLCRDADAITTYREAQLVNTWMFSADAVHAILDNPSHDGLMGGMIGVKPNFIKNYFGTWEGMINGYDLTKRGSDQNLLNQRLLPKIKNTVMFSVATGNTGTAWPKVPHIDQALWESNLTCRHIGSAGVVDLELLRFFKRFDKTDYSEFEKEHSDIMYWAR